MVATRTHHLTRHVIFVVTALVLFATERPVATGDENPKGVVVLRGGSVLIQDGAKWNPAMLPEYAEFFKQFDTFELAGRVDHHLMSFLSDIEGIYSLTIHDQPQDTNVNALLMPLVDIDSLRVLKLSFVEVSPRPSDVLALLDSLERLEVGYFLSQDDFMAISRLPKLVSLDLMGVLDESGTVLPAGGFTALEHLTVTGFYQLSHFGTLDNLNSLEVMETFKDPHIDLIRRFPGIRKLVITVDSVASASAVDSLSSVTSVRLSLSPKRSNGL